MSINFVVKWADNTNELKQNLASGLTQIDFTRAAVEKLTKSLSGEAAIRSANNWALALNNLGAAGGALAGVQKLTAAETDRATASIDRAISKYKQLGTAAPSALTDLSSALHKAKTEFDAFDDAQNRASKSGGVLSSTFSQMTAALSASSLISKATSALVDFTKQAFANADALVNLSNKTGLSTETIQRMQFVAQQSGSDMQQFADAAFKMGVNISEGTKKARDGAEALGLDWQQLRASSPDSQFEMVVAALEKMEDPQKRNAAAVALFGKTAKDILPAIIDGYTKISKEATVAGDAQVHAVDAFGDAIDRWKARTVSGFTQTIGSFLLYREAMDGLTDDEKKFVVESDRSITSMEKAKAAIIAAYQAKKQFGNITGTSGTDPSLVGSDVKLPAEKPQAPDKSFVGDLKAAEDGYRALTDAKKAEIQAALQLNTSNDDIINSLNVTDGVLVIARKAFEEHKTAVTQAAAAAKKYTEEWQKNDDETQKIWGESFVAFKNFDKDSLESHLAVLEQQRENDINAAATRIAETTGSTEQLNARVFAINEKYRGLENEARLADDKKRLEDEQKAQDIALDLESAMTKQVGELRKRQNEADAKDKAHWLAITNDAVKQNLSDQIAFERDADDTRAGLYLSDGQNRMRALDLWMTDEKAKLASRQVYSQQAEDALVQLYQSKAQAIILSNDPIFKAWQTLNVDMRSDWANTWSQALDGSISFGQAFEDTLKKSIWDPFKNILSGMLADFESILLSPMLNALKQLETAFVNYLVNAGLNASGVGGGGGGGGANITGTLLNAGVSYGGKAALGSVLGGGSAAGGSGYVSADIAHTAAASQGIGAGSLGMTLGGYAGIGIGSWELGKYLGSKTESKPLGATLGFGSGFATGATIGSIVPGVGTVVGGVIGGIIGGIAGWREAGKLYEQVKDQQADLMKQMGGMDAEIKNVGEAYALTGHTGEEAQKALHAMWDAKTPDEFAKAVAPVAEALQTLKQNTEDLQAATTDATGRISDAWTRVIDLNTKYGANTAEVGAFIKQQSGVAVDGLNAIVAAQQDAVAGYDAIKKAVDDANAAVLANPGDAKAASALADALTRQSAAGKVAAPELGDLGTAATGSYAASVASGMSKIDAVKAESSALTTLEQEYKDLGLTVEDVGLKSLFTQNDMQKGATALYAGVDGLTKRMVALDNINLETKESFAADQRTAEQMYTRLQAAAAVAGGTTADALLPMQDYLHQAEIEAKKLGVPLDALTQQMIDQSKDSGVWKDAVTPSPTMQDEMQAFVDKVDDLVQALRGLPPNVHTHVTVDTTTTASAHTGEEPGDNTASIGGYVGATRIRHFKYGGPVGTDTVNAWLTPGESVLTRSATSAIGYDTIASWNAGATAGFLQGDEQWKGPWIPVPMGDGTGDNGGFAVPAWTPPTVWTDAPASPSPTEASNGQDSAGQGGSGGVTVHVDARGALLSDFGVRELGKRIQDGFWDAVQQNKNSGKTRGRAALGVNP